MEKNSNSRSTTHDSQKPVSLGMGFISEEYEKIDPFQRLSSDTASYVPNASGSGSRGNKGNGDQESFISEEDLLS